MLVPKGEIRNNLESGLPILIYDFDGREEEVDMVFYAGAVSWKTINILRKDAGGLICYVTGYTEAKKLGLTFMTEIVKEKYPQLYKRPPYGDEPAFALWVNHVSTRTGINDEDRAKTINKLHETVSTIKKDENEARQKFYNEFYAPGHVPILISRGLKNRKGHTELTSSLLEYIGLEISGVIAEMLGDGKSLPKDKALLYAKNNGFLFIEGKEIVMEVMK
ncbi:3,4-dihydroxy-2-butanone-4-phosphate synthase [Stygiolobus caldivivus]|uniref:3,4-dihydroxy-2-butanone-4-phosphate synthase n=1 Tax=Stygiolobus caldivivus TaxID=2824673 RepID=A0A8D5U7D4_9CREN|nr:3,4-dihydroxy-2-butanone-4-phosphate synthase [Stygiolobus caldivivus]BCU70684.1 3,4-dihydroxy-2-butanone-4-phosphate synthase [Stygiolobus caldivivus]